MLTRTGLSQSGLYEKIKKVNRIEKVSKKEEWVVVKRDEWEILKGKITKKIVYKKCKKYNFFPNFEKILLH